MPGYKHVPGSAVHVALHHLAPVLEDVLRLLVLNPWLASAPGGVGAALLELRKRVATDLLVFVNGLPLTIIECKASHHRLNEVLTQLDEYARQPKLIGTPEGGDGALLDGPVVVAKGLDEVDVAAWSRGGHLEIHAPQKTQNRL